MTSLAMMPALEAGVVNRRHDLELAILHGDLHAQAAELALGLHLHVAEIVGVHGSNGDRARTACR